MFGEIAVQAASTNIWPQPLDQACDRRLTPPTWKARQSVVVKSCAFPRCWKSLFCKTLAFLELSRPGDRWTQAGRRVTRMQSTRPQSPIFRSGQPSRRVDDREYLISLTLTYLQYVRATRGDKATAKPIHQLVAPPSALADHQK